MHINMKRNDAISKIPSKLFMSGQITQLLGPVSLSDKGFGLTASSLTLSSFHFLLGFNQLSYQMVSSQLTSYYNFRFKGNLWGDSKGTYTFDGL